ncbi:hypothetical protein [Tahibacter amnicola]|uniref:Uncharacterized protein n=1 Tax=Tahibacter amnicola TaxID=2976241 RepID=A0ABY6BFQ2_9GAMM|nr:hypothetical protein [Tahibacter amnicola]UXI68858.1 hypothetical protein N4264_04155 [Tahibacter amnicola]
MDACLPADFRIVPCDEPIDCSATGACGRIADDESDWLGGEALVSPLPLKEMQRHARRRPRTPVEDDPTWNVF